MDNTNYITIQGWMVNELKLKGNELLTFAIIYGFTQDGESRFRGSCAYVADWLGSSRQTALNMLNLLTNKGLINKTETTINGIKVCDYAVDRALLHAVQNFDTININNNTLRDKDIRDINLNKYGVQNLDTDQKCAELTEETPQTETKAERLERTFALFYSEYPRKTARERAVRAWKKLNPNDQLIDEIMAGLRKQKDAGILNRNDTYTPYPATWLNGRRWEDVIITKTKNGSQSAPTAEDYLTEEEGVIICRNDEESDNKTINRIGKSINQGD